MHDVTALGELLIDFTPAGRSEAGMPRFEANPGGAPGNVLFALQRLGCRTAMIGCVGKESRVRTSILRWLSSIWTIGETDPSVSAGTRVPIRC